MSRSPTSLWDSLLERSQLLGQDISKTEYFLMLSQWVLDHSDDIGAEAIKIYGLRRLCELPPDLYAIDHADVDVQGEIAALEHVKPTSRDVLAMILRDQLWDLVAFRSQILCPNCGQEDLRILSTGDCGLILACDRCIWSQDDHGVQYKGTRVGKPATAADLESKGHLSRSAHVSGSGRKR